MQEKEKWTDFPKTIRPPIIALSPFCGAFLENSAGKRERAGKRARKRFQNATSLVGSLSGMGGRPALPYLIPTGIPVVAAIVLPRKFFRLGEIAYP